MEFFMTKIDRSELKTKAKEQLKGNLVISIGVMLLASTIISIASFTFIGTIILTGPIMLCTAFFTLHLVRTRNGDINAFFKGFDQFGSSFVAGFLTTLYIILWSFLFFIPAIIANLKYSMTYFILADNKNMSGSEAIKKSKEMMYGHKMEFFVLNLSFIGWFLLVVITFGLAGLYVYPYYMLTISNFYEAIKYENEPVFQIHNDVEKQVSSEAKAISAETIVEKNEESEDDSEKNFFEQ